jgi:hypothetical protein
VLITSRNPAWGPIATCVSVPQLSRTEAVTFLRTRVGHDDPAAAEVADELGDLPLALEQAAAYVEQRFTSLTAYLRLLRKQAVDVLQIGELLDHPTVASTWALSQAQINAEAPAAVDLLALCAFLAPDDIPRGLPIENTDLLPSRLRHAAADPLSYDHALGTLGRYSMVTATADTVTVHRLLQGVGARGTRPGHPATLGQRGCPPDVGCIPGRCQ